MNDKTLDSLIAEALEYYHQDKKSIDSLKEYYQASFPQMCSGEGLGNQMFGKTISLTEKVIERDPSNWQAYLLLSRAYKEKSYKGEGCWDNKLLQLSSEAYNKYLELKTSSSQNGILEVAVTSEDDVDSDKTLPPLNNYLKLLVQKTKNDDPEKRIEALYLISNLYDIASDKNKEYVQKLYSESLKDLDDNVRYNSAKLLKNLSPLFKSAEDLLISLLYYKENPKTKINSVWVLGMCKSQNSLKNIHEAVREYDNEIEFLRVSTTAMGRIGNKESTELLLLLLTKKSDKLLIRRSLWALGEIKAIDAIETIITFAGSDDFRIFGEAFRALLKINRPSSDNHSKEIIEVINYIRENILSLVKSKPVLGATRFFINYSVLPKSRLVISFHDGHILGYALLQLTGDPNRPVELLFEGI